MKMILAVVDKRDEEETTLRLNENKFFVTKLATTGGFFKRKNTTLLIGTEEQEVERALELLKEFAGKRKVLKYMQSAMSAAGGVNIAAPTEVIVGGCTVFIMNVENFEKF